jgi:hypothetical protein
MERTLLRGLAVLRIRSSYPDFLLDRPEAKTVLEAGGVKFCLFLSRPEVKAGGKCALLIIVENAHDTSRMIRFQIAASCPDGAALDPGMDFMPTPTAELKDGETGLIVVPIQVRSDAQPGRRKFGVSSRIVFENTGHRRRAKRGRRTANGEASSQGLECKVTPCSKPIGPTPPAPDFGYYELWNTRDLPGPKTIVDQVWNNIRTIVAKEA